VGCETKTVARLSAAVVVLGCVLLSAPRPAEAGILTGALRIVAGVVRLPLSALAGTFNGPPVVGTLFGVVNGAFQGVGLVTGGALEMAMGGAQLARMAAPLLLPFLF